MRPRCKHPFLMSGFNDTSKTSPSSFQSISAVRWFSWPSSLWPHPPRIRTFLWEVWWRIQCTVRCHPRLDTHKIWSGIRGSSVFCSWYTSGKERYCCPVYHHQQTGSRLLYILKNLNSVIQQSVIENIIHSGVHEILYTALNSPSLIFAL